MKELGMYIHIPFCVQKCFYCDFISYSNIDHFITKYIDSLIKEIKSWKERLKDYQIKSIFIGGGTPSIIPIKEMDKIFNTVYSCFEISPYFEFTIESNPGTLDKEKIKYYLTNNINRLSIGLQAWQDSLLKVLGRIHNHEEFVKNFLLAREEGFDNINVDVMFGLPFQKMNEWQETLYELIKLKPDHISAYSLKIEERTKFHHLYEDGKLKLPLEEEDRKMYHFTIDFLLANKYNHYEISNFELGGKACIHNKIYWEDKEYIGFGLGAHSYLNKCRFSNTTNIDLYIDKILNNESPKEFEEKIYRKDEISETMFLGLRMMEGINIQEFTKKFSASPLEIYSKQIVDLKNKGLIQVDHKRIYLTRKGIDLSNQVFMEFLL